MPDSHSRPEEKSGDRLLWEHYMRTGTRLRDDAAARFLERKFNPYHDPANGQFTFGPGGSGQSAGMAERPNPGSPRYPVRNPRPPSKPVRSLPRQSTASTRRSVRPAVRFSHSPGIDLPDEVVAKANVLSDAVRTATGHQIHVTSGRRGPARQAAAMYGNYSNPPPPGYVNHVAEAEVHRAYINGQKRGLSRNQVIIEMANVLSRQTSRGIHLSRHMRSGAIDIRMPRSHVLHFIRNHPTVRSVLFEDDHIHIQFK